MEILLNLAPSVATIAAVVIVLFVVDRLLRRGREAVPGHAFRDQLIMIGLTMLGVLIVILVVPIATDTRGQLLSLIGILLTAAIALSSTTFLGNAMAGVMLKSVQCFRMGDFIQIGEHFGRVSERGLFHTEIQTENRELTTLPNLYLVTHPVTTIRASGTIVAATVSLGYDVPRTRIEELLLDAARGTGLSDPFVQIMDLGDFSVTYRVAGLLAEVKQLITTRSRLRGSMIDVLHAAGVEIVSPTFMNQRVFAERTAFIPEVEEPRHEPRGSSPEALVFDKADEAESLESLRNGYKKLIEEIQALEREREKTEDESERARLDAESGRLTARKESLERTITARESEVDGR